MPHRCPCRLQVLVGRQNYGRCKMVRRKMITLAEKLLDKLEKLSDATPEAKQEIAMLREEIQLLYQLNDLLYGNMCPLKAKVEETQE